ncbi:hypothetical protein [Stieleria varia]|uniref:Uncharacterized protein n=1 Tax=Stieleria varia TaxID=2528005 RepID=A0A5C6A0B7_9BACT|nr:hypothetical protein [Stieleria varia]TWT93264.1 hypothetical protein Pla52n_59240 [Stieleria varia]
MKCTNNNVLSKRKSGLVEQMVEVVKFPFVFVVVVFNRKFIVNEGDRVPVDVPVLGACENVRKRFMTPIKQHADVVAIAVIERVPPLLDLRAFRG